MTEDLGKRFVVAGGDLVAGFGNRDDAVAQYHVMTGANIDVELQEMSISVWEQARRELAATHPDVTIVDITRGEQL
ncbi:hypothetical protein [Actinopolymorpha pittospori]|uniref:Uncharacterized protein n=1 Tax=Actinopolymorpha pittospori TaxID=648752 RepID=A0A927MY31_9ACTN|nr:hypothetical protein [Actinopolymorpha pittospori]MBE1608709.1 hypothetical protein [Actinopolymorpha pittospori]